MVKHLVTLFLTQASNLGGTPPPFMPGNAGLLYAGKFTIHRNPKVVIALIRIVAYMAAGWEGSQGDAPGFPRDGSWVVNHEGLLKAP